MKGLLVFAVFGLALTGCMHVIPAETRALADPSLSVAMLQTDPASVTGKTLLLGGVIVANLANGDGSALELIPWELDRFGEPVSYAAAPERLVAISEQCLDSEKFVPGRLVTLTATVTGQQHPTSTENVTAPEVKIGEIHLWDTPYRYGLHPTNDPDLPEYSPAWHERDNPYSPDYDPYPYTPTDIQRR